MAKGKTRRQRSSRRRRLLTRKRKGGDWPRIKIPSLRLFAGSPRSPISSVGSNRAFSPVYNENAPNTSPPSPNSPENPFYSGAECRDVPLTKEPIGLNQKSESELFVQLTKAYLSRLGGKNTPSNIQRKSKDFLRMLRTDPNFLTSIVGVVRDDTRNKLIGKFCSRTSAVELSPSSRF